METVKTNGQPKSVRNALKRSANPRSARKCAVVLAKVSQFKYSPPNYIKIKKCVPRKSQKRNMHD